MHIVVGERQRDWIEEDFDRRWDRHRVEIGLMQDGGEKEYVSELCSN